MILREVMTRGKRSREARRRRGPGRRHREEGGLVRVDDLCRFLFGFVFHSSYLCIHISLPAGSRVSL